MWTLTAILGETIVLNFDSFDLSAANQPSNCDQNFVEIYDQYINHRDPIAVYCGRDTPSTTKTVGNIMGIKLVAQQATKGFSATYDLSYCGGVYTGSYGEITSEPRGHQTNTDTDCISIIKEHGT